VNEEIKARTVRLIATDGEQVGIVPLEEALQKARGADLDLVEVAGQSDPPVCRILDYGKFRYGAKRKDHGDKPKARKQHFGQIKEIRMRPKIDKHDLERKLAKGRELLEEGYRLQVTCLFRGREMTHLELGYNLLNRTAELLADCSKLERRLSREGRRMNIMLMPKIEVVRAKAKEREAQARKHAEDAARHRKKSKARRDSVRRKAVPVDAGKELENRIEVPAEAAAAASAVEEAAPATGTEQNSEGENAQAEDSQGT
jgi:translation initiation factor IF-3